MLLLTLGIKENVFLRLYNTQVEMVRAATSTKHEAQEMMSLHAFGSPALKKRGAGFDLEDKFLRKLVAAVRNKCLLDIQRKARILVPDGVCFMGIMDETGMLPLGTVYFRSSEKKPLSAPSLHPGDLRVMTVHTAGVESQLHHLVDVMVFSQHGLRPDCNKMSGGDLDGDLYFVIWDPELIPRQSHEPMAYKHSEEVRPRTEGTVSTKDVRKFFVNIFGKLGVLCNEHLAIAARSFKCAFDRMCLKLAELHAVAVDFLKECPPGSTETCAPNRIQTAWRRNPSFHTHPPEFWGTFTAIRARWTSVHPVETLNSVVSTNVLPWTGTKSTLQTRCVSWPITDGTFGQYPRSSASLKRASSFQASPGRT